jgi:hypothetical protein
LKQKQHPKPTSFPQWDDFGRENSEKKGFFERGIASGNFDFSLEKSKKKSDPIEGIGLSFLLVPPNGIEPPTY